MSRVIQEAEKADQQVAKGLAVARIGPEAKRRHPIHVAGKVTVMPVDIQVVGTIV